MSALRCARALAGLALALGLLTACKPGVGGLYLSVAAEPGTGPATTLVLRALVEADGGDLRFEQTYDVTGRDLATEPYVIQVEAEGFADGTVARVSVVALNGGDAVAAYGGRQIVSAERVVDVVLQARDAACDGDGDGYDACERADCCPVDEATDFSDCDDANAAAHPFAETAACRACGSGCGVTDGDDASDGDLPPDVPDDAADAAATDAADGGPTDAAEDRSDAAEATDVAPEHADALPDAEVAEPDETIEVGDTTETADGADAPDACLPDCGGKACGPDGCSGSCGGCPAGKDCVDGACTCVDLCGPVGAKECTDATHFRTCGDPDADTCLEWSPESACTAGDTCQLGGCDCLPSCAGKACGDDGCGGSCGGCANGKTCTAGQCVCAGTTDNDCDNVDDDCDGQTDESYLPVSTACGTGACAATGITSCANGVVQDSCTPGEPAASEARCDGTDDDCDGATDEGCDDDGDDYCDEAMIVIGAPAACPKGAGDCYDQNVQAHPDQQGWFAVDRGDGSYDYDCSSSEEREKTTLGSCQYLVLDCKLAEQGWDDGSIAACGATEAWLQDCTWQVSCGHQTTPIKQRCH